MALDTNYVLAFSFESVFIDKDTGTVLAGGQVSFFRDIDHNTPKDIFILSGTAPNYTYVNIGSVLNIGADGCPNYNGTNVAVYFFPFTDSTATTVDLYYYEAKSSGGVLQFTRNGQPNIASQGTSQTTQINYVPSGQFLLHNDIPATSSNNHTAGQISQAVTEVAYGGWTFERPVGSTATDLVTFEQQNSYVTNPVDNPRFEIKVVCQSAGTDAFKDLRLTFNDVNKFATSATPPVQYTYTFFAKSNSGTSTVQLVLRKFYGTGGSSPDETVLATFNLNNTLTQYSKAFSFGDNSGKIISGGDDKVQICARFPGANSFSINLVDFALYEGNLTNPIPFTQTNSQMIYRALAGFFPIPAYDGSDLYLTPRLTKDGWIYDHAEIGTVIAESGIGNVYVNSVSTTTNNLLADGNSHLASGYSPLGIPFSRLFNAYFDPAANVQIPVWGTGYQFVNSSNTANSPTILRLATNNRGSVTATADGIAPHQTGFTFSTIHTGADYHINAYWINSNDVIWWDDLVGAVTAPTDAGSVGVTFSTFQNNSSVRAIFAVGTPAGSAITAGHYWQFNNTTTGFYVWYKVDGAGADPAIGGRTGIEVDILSTYTNVEVAQVTREALNGSQVSTIVCAAASTLQTGDYFTFSSNSGAQQNYYAWYSINGMGVDPAPGGTGIQVNVLSTDTAAQVAAKTQLAINSTFVGTPDLRGMFLRGIDNQIAPDPFNADPDSATRFGLTSILAGNVLGTYQFDQLAAHNHGWGDQIIVQAGAGATPNQGNNPAGPFNDVTGLTGGGESRPINAYVQYVVKY